MGNYLNPGNSGFAGDAQFRDYLNRYDVIYLDMAGGVWEKTMISILTSQAWSD